MKIAISSGKGGTGKTTLSVNLASYWAEREQIMLVDLDVEEPNSGLFLQKKLIEREVKYKMVPEWTEKKCRQHAVCHDVCNYNAIIRIGTETLVFPQLCHSCYACVELCPSGALEMKKKRIGELYRFTAGELTFVESRLDIGQEQAVPLIAKTLKYINAISDDSIKILDSPPGTSCPVIESIKEADFVILVTEPTPFGLHDLKLAVELAEEMDKKFAVVINRWGIGDDEVEKYCQGEGIDIIAKIPNNRKFAELYSNGQQIYKNDAKFLSSLDDIINYIEEQM